MLTLGALRSRAVAQPGFARRIEAASLPLLLVGLAVVGAVLAVIEPREPRPVASVADPTVRALTIRGDLPIIGDPVRDLTIWYSNRVADANKASIANLQGRFLTPRDPLADSVTRDLYAKMLTLVVPLLTIGGVFLGYLVMTSQTTGEATYTARSVTPRFVIGATLSILGIFLVSVLAQFVTTTDEALVAVSIPGNAVGGPDAWPGSGGVFRVLQNTGFDPRVGEGPGLWNTGAWLSTGLLAAVLTTLLQTVTSVLGALERLLVLVGPICLAAYAIPATQRIANLWLKLVATVLLVRFAWSIVFILFSLESLGHLDAAGNPVSAAGLNVLLGLATGAAALMLLLPLALVPLALSSRGPLQIER